MARYEIFRDRGSAHYLSHNLVFRRINDAMGKLRWNQCLFIITIAFYSHTLKLGGLSEPGILRGSSTGLPSVYL
jgi:hypothetical protein